MDMPITIKVPDYVYQFYRQAAENIADRNTEQIMADALSAYAALLNEDMMKARNAAIKNENK